MAEKEWSVAHGQDLFLGCARELASGKSNNRHPRSYKVGLPHRFNGERGVIRTQSERNQQYLILIMLENRMQLRLEQCQTHVVQRTLKDRVLQSHAKTFQHTRYPPQSFRIADVVADKVTDAGQDG